MDVCCRAATAADVPAIAAVRIRSWQEGYRGLMPQDYLDALDPVAETERWRGRDLTGQHVAEAGGRVVGWLSVGPYRADAGEEVPGPSCGEVNAIYALPSEWGLGVGRALMTHGLEELRRRGLRPVLLWVIEGNERARRFYARAGFVPDGPVVGYDVGGVTLPEVRYRRDG